MSYLWAVDCYGKVFILCTSDDHWTELESNGLDIKKVSAHEYFTWAVGGDHQIYIYIPTKDIPIRYRVVTYENEVIMLSNLSINIMLRVTHAMSSKNNTAICFKFFLD